MSVSKIIFFEDDIEFKLKNKQIIRKWLTETAKLENFNIENLNYIFCSDEVLLELNQSFLSHDTLTDIITFDNSETKGQINGEIYLSIQRIEENAIKFEIDFLNELYRVMVHGFLHLCGYNDKNILDKTQMTAKENTYLRDIFKQ